MSSPLEINLMLAAFCAKDPKSYVGKETWGSTSGLAARDMLLAEGMVDEDFNATPKGVAWVQFLCRVPFPVSEWKIPLLNDD